MSLLARRRAFSFIPDMVSDLGLRHEREGKRLFIERREGEFLFFILRYRQNSYTRDYFLYFLKKRRVYIREETVNHLEGGE